MEIGSYESEERKEVMLVAGIRFSYRGLTIEVSWPVIAMIVVLIVTAVQGLI